jgi:hypothetical protein
VSQRNNTKSKHLIFLWEIHSVQVPTPLQTASILPTASDSFHPTHTHTHTWLVVAIAVAITTVVVVVVVVVVIVLLSLLSWVLGGRILDNI